MNAPVVEQTRLVIVGATGMVGEYALRYALNHPSVERVTAIGRKKLGISHPKLEEVFHQSSVNLRAISGTMLTPKSDRIT